MTKEEKINVVKNIRNYMVSGNPIWDKDTVYEALNAAIKALERTDTNECVDLISRDKVLNLVLDACTDVMDECETVTGICGEEVYTDVREVDAILKCNKKIRNGIRQLPSEQLRPTGKWIDEGDPLTLRCSKCDYRVARYNNTNYCPNCGADMRREEFEEPNYYDPALWE